jgi:hypothetical protein
MTSDSGPAPVPASVLFLRLRAADGGAGALQAGWRDLLVPTLQKALAGWDGAHRVVLDAPDGYAIVGDVPPSVALASARLAAQHAPAAALGIGLHHGPVRAVRDTGGTHVMGDGLETASALAGFAATHPIVSSQSFREALAEAAPRQAEDLRPAGEMVDERLRPHALFVFDPDAARGRTLRRNLLAGGGLLVLLGAGWAGRVARERYEAAARRPATIQLDIRPFGDVFVDGEHKGAAPPLVKLSLPPGPHSIEVRSGRSQPLRLQVQLQPGEVMQVSHVFTQLPPPRRPQPRPQPQPSPFERLERFKFW